MIIICRLLFVRKKNWTNVRKFLRKLKKQVILYLNKNKSRKIFATKREEMSHTCGNLSKRKTTMKIIFSNKEINFYGNQQRAKNPLQN